MNIYQYLYSRSFDPSRYHCSIGYEKHKQVLAVNLYNLTGELVGYQIHRPWSMEKKVNDPKTGRYYTYTSEGYDGVFGLEACRNDGRPWYIVEGIFKAAKLHSLGYNSIAVLTSHPKRMRPWFRILKATRPLIGIGDNDPAGQKLVNTVKRGSVSPKDLDEMDSADVISFLKGL